IPPADRPPEQRARGPVRRLRRPRAFQNPQTIFRLRVPPAAGQVFPYSRPEDRSANFGERARATSLERTRERSSALPLDIYRRLRETSARRQPCVRAVAIYQVSGRSTGAPDAESRRRCKDSDRLSVYESWGRISASSRSSTLLLAMTACGLC